MLGGEVCDSVAVAGSAVVGRAGFMAGSGVAGSTK